MTICKFCWKHMIIKNSLLYFMAWQTIFNLVLTTPAAASAPPVVARSPVIIRQAQSSVGKKRDTSGTKAIHNCDSCGKSFTTKFNLKRHINMHCHKSRENGIPIQGPPSASAPAKKPDPRVHKQFVPLNYQVGNRPQVSINILIFN